MKKERKVRKEQLGLKRLRKNGSRQVFECPNCKKVRYAPCTCTDKSSRPDAQILV